VSFGAPSERHNIEHFQSNLKCKGNSHFNQTQRHAQRNCFLGAPRRVNPDKKKSKDNRGRVFTFLGSRIAGLGWIGEGRVRDV
jgi:hypothetical protein